MSAQKSRWPGYRKGTRAPRRNTTKLTHLLHKANCVVSTLESPYRLNPTSFMNILQVESYQDLQVEEATEEDAVGATVVKVAFQ